MTKTSSTGALFANSVVVTSEADFPPINGSSQHPLAADTVYQIDGLVTVVNNFLIPDSGNVAIIGNSIPDTLTYTGGGTMFVQPAHDGGSVFIGNMILNGNSTATWVDITDTSGTLEVVWSTTNILEFASLGSLDVGSIAGLFTTHSDYAAPLDCTVKSDFFMSGSIFASSSGTSDGLILRMGVDTIAQLIDNTPFIGAGESLVEVPATANDFRLSVSGNLIPGALGDLFDPTGLNFSDPRIEASDNIGYQDSDVFGSFLWAKNTTDTVISLQGRDGSIASFADAGGGLVTATTSVAHDLTNGESVSISENSGYDGYHAISNITATTFDFTATFVATGTGAFSSGWTLLGGTTYESEVQRSSMTNNNELTFVNLANHEAVCHISLTVLRGAGNGTPTMGFMLFRNGAPLIDNGREIESQNDTNNATPRAVNLSPPLCIGTDDVFSVYGRNITNTSNLLITNGQVTLT